MSASCIIVSMPPEGTVSIASQVRRSLVSMEMNAMDWTGRDLLVFLGKLNYLVPSSPLSVGAANSGLSTWESRAHGKYWGRNIPFPTSGIISSCHFKHWLPPVHLLGT